MPHRILLLLLVFNASFAVAQFAPAVTWQRSLGGGGDDEAYVVRQTSDGGYITAGFTRSNNGDVSANHGGADYWVVKLNAAGNTIWKKTYGGSKDDIAHDIRQTTDGGYIVAGESLSIDGDLTGSNAHGVIGDYWIVKLDALGNISWNVALGGSGEDAAYSIQQTSDGYVVAGFSQSNDGDVHGHHTNSTSADYWIVKINTTGAIQWDVSLGGFSVDDATGIQQTIDNGYIVCGWSTSQDGDITNAHTSNDYWIVKLNSTGGIVWEKSLGGSDFDVAQSIQQTRDGGYIVAGFSRSNDFDVSGHHGFTTTTDYWIVKLNSTGGIVWQQSYGGSGTDEAYSIVQTDEGGYGIAGLTNSDDDDVTGHHGNLSASDFWILKIDSLGTIEWQQSYGGSGIDDAFCIQQTSDGAFVLAGRSTSSDGDATLNHGGEDFWIVKLGAPFPIIGSSGPLLFGELLCETMRYDTVNVSNTGTAVLKISNAVITDPSCTLISPAVPVNIGRGDSLQFVVAYAPTVAGPLNASLDLYNNDTIAGHNPWHIVLTGIKDSAGFARSGVRNDTMNFGDLRCSEIADSGFVITNASTIPTTFRLQSTDTLLFTLSDSLITFSNPGDQQIVHVHFVGWVTPLRYTGLCLISDTCGRVDTVVLVATVDSGLFRATRVSDTSICLGDSTTRSVMIHNASKVVRTIYLHGNDSVFAITPDSLAIAADDSAVAQIRFTGSNATGDYFALLSMVDDCGITTLITAKVRVDSAGLVVQAIPDTTICPGTFTVQYTTVRNISTTTLTATLMQSDTLFALSPNAVTLAPGDSASIEIIFHGSPASGVYVMNCDLPGCGGTHVIAANIRVDVPKLSYPQTLDTLVCPDAPMQILIPIHNSGSFAHTITFDDTTGNVTPHSCVLSGGNDTTAIVMIAGVAAATQIPISFHDDCGGNHTTTISITVRPDSAFITAQQIPAIKICPNDSAQLYTKIFNISADPQRLGFAGNAWFTVVPDSLTLAQGDSAQLEIYFHGAADTGTFILNDDLPGCGNSHLLTATVRVDAPHINVPAVITIVVCPNTPVVQTVAITNADTVIRSITLTSSTCTLSAQTMTLASGATDSLTITFPGGTVGVDSCNVHVVDACGFDHTITEIIQVHAPPALALSLQSNPAPQRVGDESTLYLIASPAASIANSNFVFSISNEPTALQFDSVQSPCMISETRGMNTATFTVATCPQMQSDTIATLYYNTLVGSTLAPTVTLENVQTANTCDTVSGAGFAAINILPPGCELGTVIVHPFTSAINSIYPNPATGITTVTYSTVENANLTIDIRDLLGRIVHTLVHAVHQPGVYATSFDSQDLVNGVYSVLMHEGSVVFTKPLLITR